MKKVTKLAGLALLGLVTIGMWAQDDAGDTGAAKPAKPAVPEVQVSGAGVPADYIIGADDVLHISVWKEPDMNVTLPVRPDGKISIPLLDDVQAAGMTPMQLGISIRDKLKKYIADPRVTVVVTATALFRRVERGRRHPCGCGCAIPWPGPPSTCATRRCSSAAI